MRRKKGVKTFICKASQLKFPLGSTNSTQSRLESPILYTYFLLLKIDTALGAVTFAGRQVRRPCSAAGPGPHGEVRGVKGLPAEPSASQDKGRSPAGTPCSQPTAPPPPSVRSLDLTPEPSPPNWRSAERSLQVLGSVSFLCCPVWDHSIPGARLGPGPSHCPQAPQASPRLQSRSSPRAPSLRPSSARPSFTAPHPPDSAPPEVQRPSQCSSLAITLFSFYLSSSVT